MESHLTGKILIAISLLFFELLFSQQKISGKIVDNDKIKVSSVLIFNVTKNIRSSSDISGSFEIEAEENDELRFVKEGFYRTYRIIKKENFNSQMNVDLLRAETLIPEVRIVYKPTGNLEKDNKHFNDSRKVSSLKSSMEEYMKSELREPLPKNEIPKTFQGHDFQAGQINMISLAGAIVGLVTKASAPKITAPTFGETQDFLSRIKKEINLTFLTKYGMNEERIEHFLYYAERVNHLSKRYRKNFKPMEIESELKGTFSEYSKLNKLSD